MTDLIIGNNQAHLDRLFTEKQKQGWRKLGNQGTDNYGRVTQMLWKPLEGERKHRSGFLGLMDLQMEYMKQNY